MLTQKEKDKIATLRTYFTDQEWSLLSSSDDYARERIDHYSSILIPNLNSNLEFFNKQTTALTTQIAQVNAKLNILT